MWIANLGYAKSSSVKTEVALTFNRLYMANLFLFALSHSLFSSLCLLSQFIYYFLGHFLGHWVAVAMEVLRIAVGERRWRVVTRKFLTNPGRESSSQRKPETSLCSLRTTSSFYFLQGSVNHSLPNKFPTCVTNKGLFLSQRILLHTLSTISIMVSFSSS